jgi:Fe-S oxidoreductase
MSIGSRPDWIKGIRHELDYGWRYHGDVKGILTDVSIVLDGFDVELAQFLALKDIALSSSASCFQCGTCNAVCPYTHIVTEGEILSARRMLHEKQLGLTTFEGEEMWMCTTCDSCVESCPRGVKVIDFMRDLRRVGVELYVGNVPDSLRWAMKNIAGVGNPFGEPRERRTDWAKHLDVKPYIKGMELLYFPGCFPSYDPRARKVAQAMVTILNKAGVDFGILGSREVCCGESVRKAGNESLFQTLAEHNITLFDECGVKKIITNSPHCYHTFKNEYPQVGGDFEVFHYTQYLAQLIGEGRLKFTAESHKRVTYHDPCYLCRHNAICDEPREILQSIPGLELVEMTESFHRSMCCGGGGGRIWLETKKGERLSNLRLKQAIETGASILAVSCPYCLANFEDSRLGLDSSDCIEIKDIAELVCDAI